MNRFHLNLCSFKILFPFYLEQIPSLMVVGIMRISNLYTSWPLETRDKLAREEAKSRIVNDPMGFITLVPKKFYRLFGANDYGNEWSLQYTKWKNNQNYEIIEPYILKINSLISQALYVTILLFTLMG